MYDENLCSQRRPYIVVFLFALGRIVKPEEIAVARE
jgi:hypothetical protein